ncbi:gigantea [Musa troglodytarum]|uniref:Gigantea n=1 Tax=Musa troglodytarum TaxID=320322 RepID=A0A9E7KI80_9LILI|nr:gigantea [Musa troglodytarum]
MKSGLTGSSSHPSSGHHPKMRSKGRCGGVMGKYAAGGELKPPTTDEFTEEPQVVNGRAANRNKNRKKQGPVSTFDSYVLAAAEKDLQPWIARDDEQGQRMWKINHRIVKLIVELMRNHEGPEALIILASASDLLLRATDGMLVDGEVCTLPQLELLEVTAKAVQLVIHWGEPGLAVADGLANLLKCRLSSTVRCLSHPSAHVRALSASVLRDILHSSPTTISSGCLNVDGQRNCNSSYRWQADIEKCIQWEAQSRLATGLTLAYLCAAAKEFGCPIN